MIDEPKFENWSPENKAPLAELLPQNHQIVRAPAQDLMLTAAFDVDTAQKRLVELQKFVEFYMKEGEDYGTIPGTPKPTLFKPGADKLCDIYAMADTYRLTNRTEDWDRNLFDYEVECTLLSKRTGQLVATGLGSCNSYEGKYRWRENKRKCPVCSKETIIKGKPEFTKGQAGFENGGWVCWKKEGKSDGCGSKFADADPVIASQIVGKSENDDIPTLKNTILKMAKKRAKVDAVLSATRSSGLFTQDMDDIQPGESQGSKEAQQAVADRKIAEHKAKTAQKPAGAPTNGKNGHEAPDDATVVLELIGEGLLGLSGKGLAIVKSEMNADDRNYFNIRSHNGKWTMRADLADKFRDLCRRLNVGTTVMGNLPRQEAGTRGPMAPEKASIPPFTSPGKSGSTDPILMDAVRVEKDAAGKPRAKPYLSVKWNGRQHNCFNKGMWGTLETAKDLPVMLEVKANGNYSNIVRVLRVDGISFEDEQNQTESGEEELRA